MIVVGLLVVLALALLLRTYWLKQPGRVVGEASGPAIGNEKGRVIEREESLGSNTASHLRPTPVATDCFRPFDAQTLGNSPLDHALRSRQGGRVFYYYVGRLEAGSEYAVLVSYHEEWLDVLTLNRARTPTYERHGYSIIEERWAGGSRPLGGQEIKAFLRGAREEVLAKVAALADERTARDERRAGHQAREAAEQRAYEQELRRVQEARQAAIEAHFATIQFEYNANRARHEAARKECAQHYCELDLEEQSCSCDGFREHHVQFPKGDIRRLCRHLVWIVYERELLKRHRDPLVDFVLKEHFRDIAGIHVGDLSDGKKFAVVARRETTTVPVIVPRVRGQGYLKTFWSYENEDWTSRSCSQKYRQQIQTSLRALLPC